MFCPQCGTNLPDGCLFCAQCGADLALANSMYQQIETDQPQVQPAAQQPQAQQPAQYVQPQQVVQQPAAQAQPTPQPVAQAQPTPQPAAQAQPAYYAQQQQVQQVQQPAWAVAGPAVQGGAAVAKAPINMKAILIALIAAIAVIVGVFLLVTNASGGGYSPTARVSANPVVVDKGREIRAFERPSLIGVLPAYAEETTTPSVPKFTIESNLANVANESDVYDKTARSLLEKNGFAVSVNSSYYEFFEIYERNRYAYKPNFVTTDSMMHTYHLYFQYLLKNTERNYLSSQLSKLSKDMLEESTQQLKTLSGTEWETAAKRACTLFGVGAVLLDPSTQVPIEVSDAVNAEVANINAHNGFAQSAVMDDLEDYSQYIVRGYYEGDENLERYFRAMMWYGRMNFAQKNEDMDRTALLITLALQSKGLQDWEGIYTVTSFFAGASDDCGYYEYYPLFQAVYGENATVADLAGRTSEWKHYHELTAKMPAPQINSVVVKDEGRDVNHEEEEKGFRFMGQRFSIDEMVFQNLCYNKTGENSKGQKRMLPDALDVPAALGSDEALAILTEKGATDYADYSKNMDELRKAILESPDELWSGSLYSQWLYTLNPLLEVKGEGYPQFMQTKEWTRKNLQTYLGSYTELKHDTVLYSKQMLSELGGGPQPKDDRGYVEPEPELYNRLANLTQATADGLKGYGMLGSDDEYNLNLLKDLATKLTTISEKELRNETLTSEEYDLIRTYGGQLEHFWEEVYKNETTKTYLATKEFPAALVVDVATDGDAGKALELGTGYVSTVYVLVPIDGKLRVATGSVYSFYQFDQPISNRLTDTKWRQMMGIELSDNGKYDYSQRRHVEDWTLDFQFENFGSY